MSRAIGGRRDTLNRRGETSISIASDGSVGALELREIGDVNAWPYNGQDGAAIAWRITAEHIEKYAAQIRTIADNGGHHYLDAPKGADIDVMVSRGDCSASVFADGWLSNGFFWHQSSSR